MLKKRKERKGLKKGIMILILLVFAITTTMMMVPQAKAAIVVIHDHPTNPVVKPKGECIEVINAIDGVKEPQWSTPPGGLGNIWLRGIWGLPRGSTTVSFTKRSTVIYVQYHSSDDNDHNTDIYVDGVLVARIETYMRGDWYVEIRGLLYTKHTVKVHASDTPPVGDNDVWYFGIPALSPVGGIAIPIDKLGLLAPYIGLASTIVVATVVTAIYAKRVKRRKEKQ